MNPEKLELTRSEENYLEAILTLEHRNPTVRVKDVADAMGVRMASVTNILKKLDSRGMVRYERYGNVSLTDLGRTHAERVMNRHRLLEVFFHKVLGVDRETAEADACKVEHALSRQTVEKLLYFLESNEYIESVQRNIVQRSESAFADLQLGNGSDLRLTDLVPGQTSVVVAVNAAPDEAEHLRSLGFGPGAEVERVGSSSLDTVSVRVHGLALTLTVSEASMISVRPAKSKCTDA
ncbi:MAG: metal-dependent transcriptional regulator [Bacillota bacterium]|jgi:DtxR family Mn-dependent transcriptional regulator|nr:metal-dependent transcriptional regulator [Bacillota bacterium]HQD17873.1 metal-dependent transcriptional regulator [Bacillota bacterium]